MALVLLMLCSGFLHIASAERLRFFQFITSFKGNRTDAIQICEQQNASLVTWYDDDDAEFTLKYTVSVNDLFSKTWLGLKKPSAINTTWSDGSPLNFNKSTVERDDYQKCETINGSKWMTLNCSEKMLFMCKDMEYPPTIIKKNWCQAVQYCRKHNTDLVSIHDESENQHVINMGQNGHFWIGLQHDEWQWEDTGCSTFRKWNNSGARERHCTIHFLNEGKIKKLFQYRCDVYDLRVICSKGNVRIKVSKHNLTWHDAYDYCKEHHTRMLTIQTTADQDAVIQWLKHTTHDVGPFWIGLRQSRVFGFWIWATDTVVDYNEWEGSQTPQLPFSSHCGVISNDGNYKWKDENCLIPLRFICEEEILFMGKP